MTFIDDKTRYIWVYIIKNKSDVFSKFCEWKKEVENQFGHRVKTLRTDNGGEYMSHQFEQYLKSEGVRHEHTIPKCPEQNGTAERLNRTLIEMVRAMLADSKLDKCFWAEALSTAVYLRNRCPTRPIEHMTPYEALFGERPKVDHLRIFGCTAFSFIPKDERRKLDDKSRKCIFLGYSSNQKGYRLYDLERKRIFHSRDVKFNELECGIENTIVSESSTNGDQKIITDIRSDADPVSDESDNESEDHEEEIQEPIVRRSTRRTRPPDYYGVWVNSVESSDEPQSVKDAISSYEKEMWEEAMQAEIESLHRNKVWNLIAPPKDRKIINCKWVFKRKRGENGTVERYKARLVACGYTQRQGLDYEETFSPVVRFESVRCVLALAAHFKMKLHQMDVKTAFLNGELTEEVYMSQPEGFKEKGKENYVCQLKRSIYGLKQSPRCWNATLDMQLKSMGFAQTKGDPCLYVSIDGDPVIIAVYVDDILIAAVTDEKISEVKAAIAERFDVKDMGELSYFLGIKVVQDPTASTIWIGQPNYIESLISDFDMTNAKCCNTPINVGEKLSKATEESIRADPEKYQSAVGRLLYLSTTTRPDIAFAVSSVAKYTSDPTVQHWKAVKHIIRYLIGTVGYGLMFRKKETAETEGYSDADWAGDIDDRKSTSGYLFKLSGASISWRSRKQSCVALSTAEAEYISLATAGQEAIWLSRLITELKRGTEKPVTLYEDNQAAICLSKNPQFHGRSKHIAIKYHFIRDEVQKGSLTVPYCKTEEMAADMMTKGLYSDRFSKLRKMAGVEDLKSDIK